ncbi:Dirigent protein [Dillenia turbinata]|uniref:Dirigent protein n=1 Tax=Dillenia turbinata TaxID=194707 RepID=A0AAN8UWD3_9MAGN
MKAWCVVLTISLMVTMSSSESKGNGRNQNAESLWAKTTKIAPEKQTMVSLTNLQFYFHDTLSGPTPSATTIATSRLTNTSKTLFGLLNMVDDPLTIGPDLNSKVIGRARGIYGCAGQTSFGIIMALGFVFLEGKYNGSTISINGLNTAMNPVRELTIVGGTGVFQMARGVAHVRTIRFDPVTLDATMWYNVTVYH